jgi:hypothetical protein
MPSSFQVGKECDRGEFLLNNAAKPDRLKKLKVGGEAFRMQI